MKPLTKEQEKAISNLYYEKALKLGRDRMYQRLKQDYPLLKVITKVQVNDWLQRQPDKQINSPQSRDINFKPILPPYPLHSLAIDLQDYSNFPGPSGVKYLLVILDMFSRYVWTAKITSKSPKTVTKATEKILDSIEKEYKDRFTTKLLISDMGSEFKAEFASMLKERNINHIITPPFTPQANGRVERVNRTLKTMNAQKTKQNVGWFTNIYQTTEDYNNTYHTIIKATPDDVLNFYEDSEIKDLYKMLKEKANLETEKSLKSLPKTIKDDLVKGDKVRLKINKGDKTKRIKDNWTEDIYTIERVIYPKKSLNIVKYQLRRDIDNILFKQKFKRSDLLKIPK